MLSFCCVMIYLLPLARRAKLGCCLHLPHPWPTVHTPTTAARRRTKKYNTSIKIVGDPSMPPLHSSKICNNKKQHTPPMHKKKHICIYPLFSAGSCVATVYRGSIYYLSSPLLLLKMLLCSLDMSLILPPPPPPPTHATPWLPFLVHAALW